MPPHNFSKSLSRSQQFANAFWWEQVYRRAFPGFSGMQYVAKDGWAQRGGIDRQVFTGGGKVVCIDEKVREEDWPDILLERWSDRERGIPGWIQNDLATDYIAYALLCEVGMSHRNYPPCGNSRLLDVLEVLRDRVLVFGERDRGRARPAALQRWWPRCWAYARGEGLTVPLFAVRRRVRGPKAWVWALDSGGVERLWEVERR